MTRPADVFLVDDNPANLTLLSGILRGRGYRVRMLDDGTRAVAAIRSAPPDLVLLDISMPEMDGFEVCRQLKASDETARVPVLFISALDEASDKVEAFRCGGVDYVTKPFQAEEVLARVETHLKIAALQRQTEERAAELQIAYEEVRRKEEELRRAHDTIARLSESATRLEDMLGWARARSQEIAAILGVPAIHMWRLERGRLVALVGEQTAPAPWDPISGPLVEALTASGAWVLPVLGTDGQPRGAIAIDAFSVAIGEVEREIVLSFARHLGAALELSELRRRLAAAESRRAATRRELRRQGIATVGICPRCAGCYPEATDGPSICPEDKSLLDGSRLLPLMVQGRHRLQAFLGEGGMGSVFRARDESLKRDVALKIIRPENLKDPAYSARLMREAETIARVRHPGVVALHDAGELPDGSAFLVMELLQGVELRLLLERHGRGTARQVARLVRQAGAALAAVHRVGVIHRDVKPANIFLVDGLDGFAVKLTDFGLALPMKEDTRLTSSGLIVGTPTYMAPEQASGPDVDARADLYSLAAVAYEALVGQKRITSTRLVEILVEVLYVDSPPPSTVRSGLPPEVDALFARALAKRPDDRPSDVLSWSLELAAVLDVMPEEPGGWSERAWTSRA